MQLCEVRRWALAVAAGLSLLGCQEYEPLPLDETAVRDDYLSRNLDSESLRNWIAERKESLGQTSPTFDPSDGLTADEAEVVALFFNPDLRRIRAEKQAKIAGLREAGQVADPVFGLDAERIVESVEEPWIVGGTMGLVLPLSGRLEVERSLATREVASEWTQIQSREWQTRFALRAAWLEWTAEELRTQALQTHLGRLDEISVIVARLEAAGELPLVETRLFALERASRRNELLLGEQRRERSALRLRSWLGLSGRAPVQFLPSLDTPALVGDAAERLRLAEQKNTSLRLARASYAVAEEALHLEVRKQYPDLSLAPGASSDEGVWRALLGFSLPLPVWNGNRQALASAHATRDALRTHFAATLEEVHANLAAAELAHQNAEAAVSDLEQNLIPLTDRQFEDARRAARLGQFDAILTLDSLARLQDARERWILAVLAREQAALSLVELQGPVDIADDWPAEKIEVNSP